METKEVICPHCNKEINILKGTSDEDMIVCNDCTYYNTVAKFRSISKLVLSKKEIISKADHVSKLLKEYNSLGNELQRYQKLCGFNSLLKLNI